MFLPVFKSLLTSFNRASDAPCTYSQCDNAPERALHLTGEEEEEEKHHSYKIIRNKKTFSLIAKFGAKNEETTPLKNNASTQKTVSYQDKKQVYSEDKLCKPKRKRGKKISSPRASGVESTSQNSDKNQDSSNVGQAEQPKLKKTKTPAQAARDSARRKAFWKRTKVARKLRAENFAAYYAKLQDTKILASPQFYVASDPENSGPCLDSTTVRTVARSKVTAVSQQTCLDTNSSVSAVKRSSILLKNFEDSEKECACCSNKGNQTELRRCTGCKTFSYCSRDCQKSHWSSHRELCKSIQSLNSQN